MIHAWSLKIAEYISNELNIQQNKKAILAYGFEVMIGAINKLLIFIVVPWVFGMLPEFMTAYLSFAFLRIVAGGIHCSAFYRCLFVSVISYLAIAFAAIHLSVYPLPYKELYWGVLGLSLLIVLAKAPVDVQEKPIINPKRRLRLKVISCLVIVLYLLISVYWNLESSFYIASGLAVLFQVFTITKNGIKFFNWIDQII